MINRIFLLGRLTGPPIPTTSAGSRLAASPVPEDRSEASGSTTDYGSLVLPLITFAPRLTFVGDLHQDRQQIDVHVSGRLAELAPLILEPGQLLWVDGRLESDPAVRESSPSGDSELGSTPIVGGLRIVASWFTILASTESSEHLEGAPSIASRSSVLSPVAAWVRGGRSGGFEAESGTPQEAAGGAP